MDGDMSFEFSSKEEEEEDWAQTQARDEANIQALLGDTTNVNLGLDSEKPLEIDQSKKAEDAIDYEDIDLSDEDLPDEEEPSEQPSGGASAELPSLTDDGGTSYEVDDLFGEGRESSPLLPDAPPSPQPEIQETPEQEYIRKWQEGQDHRETIEELRALNFQDKKLPGMIADDAEACKLHFPDFTRGVTLDYNALIQIRQCNWIPKQSLKPPKPLIPTKLSLDIDVDQEKQFRIPGPTSVSIQQKIQAAENAGLVSLLVPERVDEADLEIFKVDSTDDFELVGGFTLQDIETVCLDWDSIIDPPVAVRRDEPATSSLPPGEPDEDEEWNRAMGFDDPPTKRRKVTHEKGLPEISRFVAPSFDQFDEATKRSAKRVRLDMNDPFLLIDDMESERPAKRPRQNHKMKRMADGKMARDIFERFNFSNDDAYEALKENVRDKVRATLGGVQVEHSLPALKLLWPYYLVKLTDPNPFNYHRPHLKVRKNIKNDLRFVKPQQLRRKDLKGQKIQDIYKHSRDLTLNDNSTAVLFEYCEEIPTVLSNFGMGNRVINYYRVKDSNDEKPPVKLEIGENKVLLAEDRSPFAIFGSVNAGEIVPTLQNQMYRAPVFKHTPRKTDFIIGRSSTGLGQSNYYLRKIDHLFVVGQNFPSIEVPGPHSRKVTNTSKNRLKMLSYRLITKKGAVGLTDITEHVKDSNDAQNRQKLKEFLSYDKESRSWGLNEGEKLMDPDTINSMVQPEDVCLMDAMQIGAYEVEKSGFTIDEKDLDKDDDDAEPTNDNLANQLAPWKTTKAFIDATSGKAMLKLRGEGDPTGKGLGFSFIKTSMKGGFLNVLHELGSHATSADAMERERKANNGHSYNVKKQEAAYQEVINDIWGKQKETLEDATTYDDADVQPQEDEDERLYPQTQPAATPRFDESMSVFSRPSATSTRHGKRKLRIQRKQYRADGTEEWIDEIVEDPGVIAQYIKSRRQLDEETLDKDIKFTGDAEADRKIIEKIEREQNRLEKNKERRHQREKQKKQAKGIADPSGGSPEPSVEGKAAGTTRKCANCGQVGHIKTNKKYTPHFFR
ncbi:putative transcription initiation factor tfiid subunit 1 protein [Phaeoacremonium minimum UCRPA7]|uniref:Putative transcription initiation factor tfiid subunit 1 protein n=1 Tax=Phaeoacremonium minimum (strain UCR-PA7) TaxID=1286976 RepID=R8BV48_PHAM7|nr:putative transcription initiation factor tfiid subunit 1 protein [Phaeoacremonium minimum UCRPA7]EOO03232.1 putative transcription initiation factor tfiid subunit 1 protein [Phaeoacremonium minimum UCRPA7]